MDRCISKPHLLLSMAVVLSFNEPRSVLELVPWLHLLWRLGYWMSVVICIGRRIVFRKRLGGLALSMVTLFLWILFDGFIVHDAYEFGPVVYNPLACLCLVLFVEVHSESHPGGLVTGVVAAYALLVLSNLISMAEAPGGLYEATSSTGEAMACWILGFKNSLHEYCIVFVGSVMLYVSFSRAGRCWSDLAIALSIATVAIAHSGTGIVVSVVMTALYFGGLYRKRFVNVKTVLALYAAAFVFLMTMTECDFLHGLTGLLGKDITLTGRTNIWEVCWQRVCDFPICGFGLVDPLVRANMVEDAVGAINAHNTLLELLFNWGVVGLSLWFLGFSCAVLRLVEFKGKDASADCLLLALICFLPVTLVEERSFSVNLFMILAFASQVHRIAKVPYG